MILQDTFADHLTHLNEADPSEIVQLYQYIAQRQPWPRIRGVLLNPLSLIAYSVAQLAGRLLPNEEPLSIPEVEAIAQAIGMIQYQFTAIATIISVGLTPSGIEGNIAVAMASGMSTLAQEIASILGYSEMPNGEETEEA